MIVKVQKVGNSLMVVIPKPLAKEVRLAEGNEVVVTRVTRERKETDSLRIKPVRRKKYKWQDVIGSISIPNFKMADVLKTLADEYGR